MSLATFFAAFAAGVLSTLSPCVLPILPLILATATSEHRFAPVALTLGLATSFVIIGVALSSIGVAIGFDASIVKKTAAVLLVLIGLVLVVPRASELFATLVAPLAARFHGLSGRLPQGGLLGKFLLGLTLGAVWTPCVGPTLGAATVLASQGKDLAQVTLVMTMFGLGAAVPLLVIGAVGRQASLSLRGGMLRLGQAGKIVLGVFLIATGLLVITGFDRTLESALTAASPAWLTELTTTY